MSLDESKQRKAGSALSYLQTIVSILISLIYTPVMLSLLGKTEYGLYNIAATTISYVNFLNLGFSSSYVRFYARDKARKDKKALAKTNGLFCIVFLIIGILALFAGIIITHSSHLIFNTGLTESEYVIVRKIMLILTISTAYNLGTSVFSSIVLAHERFVFHKAVNLIKTILSPSLTWILLLSGYRSIAMALVSSLLTIISDTFYVIYCFSKLKIKIDLYNPSREQLKEIFIFSGFIALNSIVDQINWSIDKLLLGRIWGAAYTAVYSVAGQINTMYMQISTAISNVFIPSVNRLVAQDSSCDELSDFFIRIGRLQVLILMPILTGFIFFGQAFINLWTPKGYEEVYIITLLLIIPATVSYIQNIGITIQTAQNKHKFRSIIFTAMALINLVISIILCKRYGAIGCAIGTSISLVFANGIIMNIYYYKVIKLDIARFWRNMAHFLPTLSGISITGYLIKHLVDINSWLQLILWGILFCFVYAVLVWFSGMNKDEKRIVFSIFNCVKHHK